jgi:hypothetical protein
MAACAAVRLGAASRMSMMLTAAGGSAHLFCSVHVHGGRTALAGGRGREGPGDAGDCGADRHGEVLLVWSSRLRDVDMHAAKAFRKFPR